MHQSLVHIDAVVLLLYFSSVLAVGISASRRKDTDSSTYFLSGRNLGWLSIGGSIIAADALSGHIVGMGGHYGVLLAFETELAGIVGVVALGWWFGPALMKRGAVTMTGLFDWNGADGARPYVSGSYIAMYLFSRLSLVLLIGGSLIRQFSSADVYVPVATVVLVAGLYSIIGGFSSVVKTQVLQAGVMLAGFLAIVGGVLVPASGSQVVSTIPVEVTQMTTLSADAGFPWIAFLIGIPLMVFWFFFTDQYILQHILGAKSEHDLERGALAVVAVKVVVAGALWGAFLLLPSGTGPVALVGSMSPFVRELVLVAILAAMMSSLAGLYNSASALFTVDLYKRRNPDASERKLVLVGRLSTTVVVVLSMLWMPLLGTLDIQGSGFLQSTLAYFAAALAAVLMPSALWKRTTSTAALCAAGVGITAAALRLVTENLLDISSVTNKVLLWFVQTHYLNYASLIFVICLLTVIGVSLLAPSTGSGETMPQVQRNI